MEQLQLLIRDQNKQVSLEVILSQQTFRDALKLCKSISGLDDKQICSELNIDQAQWSRIWSGNGHFPENLLNDFMRVCQNMVPLIWLSYRNGYAPHPLKNEIEMQEGGQRG